MCVYDDDDITYTFYPYQSPGGVVESGVYRPSREFSHGGVNGVNGVVVVVDGWWLRWWCW